jgi:fumarate reductase flavoprotein subunit
MQNKRECASSRRDFIKGTAAGIGAVALAGFNPKEANAIIAVPVPEKWDYTADVLIIGAGIGGRMAAIEAHNAGAKVLLVDRVKMPTCGGASSVCGGLMGIAGTSAQAKEGIQDTPDLLYEDMMKTGRYSNIPELVRLYVDNAAEAYDHLLSYGAKLMGIEEFGGMSRKRSHQFKNTQVLDALYAEIQKRKISTLSNTRGKSLIEDPKTGRVLGVEAEGPGGKKVYLKGKVTILATGGFCGSPEMIDKYVPRARGALACGLTPSSVGDGFKMALAIGADATHPYSVTTYPHGYPLHGRMGSRWAIGSNNIWPRGAISVNKEGKRYVSEMLAPCDVGESMLVQPDKLAFTIADDKIWKNTLEFAKKARQWEVKLFEEKKIPNVWFADTLDALAAKIGVDPRGLEKTVAQYNSFVEKGIDEAFNRPKESMKSKIENPPYMAVKLCLVILHGSGGLRANTKLQVLDVYDRPIPGLYAVGEVLGGTSGEVYLSTTHYPVAMTFGYLAGKKFAVQEAMKA